MRVKRLGEGVRLTGLAVGVCIYKSGPAGYKIIGIDTERENTSMFHQRKKRKRGGATVNEWLGVE